jgi:regulator of protease activity HflC (stomatin/prohibitin superfamily)
VSTKFSLRAHAVLKSLSFAANAAARNSFADMPLLTSTVHVILFWPGRLAPASFLGSLEKEFWMVKYLVLLFGLLVLEGYARYNWSLDPKRTEHDMQQLNSDMSLEIHQERMGHYALYHGLLWGGFALIGLCALYDLRAFFRRNKDQLSKLVGAGAVLVLLTSSGCRQPFEPIKLEAIGTNEEAFLIPWTGDTQKQDQLRTEDFLAKSLVVSKQVRIPQQWVQKGYNYGGWNGQWQDAAILIKVEKAPITREWTADADSGTSNRNEAIWVMTSDQVEFSTGWTCTARIIGRDEAVKFLYNYPNGSLEKVLDHEVRSKLQADWTLEVTDLPMDELRKKATPHIQKVVTEVTTFFKNRGIDITNLGITGGFVYKDTKIRDTVTRVFNAEQEKNVTKAETEAQRERNNKSEIEIDTKAKNLIKEKKAEADGIKLVADAKAYEMDKAKISQDVYLALKQIELEKNKIERWDGRFPTYYMGASSPNMLLNVPTVVPPAKPQAR